MSDSIKVVVKVRPLIRREVEDKLPKLWASDQHRLWPVDSQRRDCYTFDNVFDESSSTLNLYDKVARPIVEATINGINGTIFAYGQTSSGKTYTMMGNKDSRGIIPLAVNNVFKLIESTSDRDFLIRVSFIEIYNEKIKDLLDLSNADVKIREDYNSQISVTCKEIVTTTPEKVLQIMQQGNQNRSVGETSMNDTSSRSHSIFQIIIESRKHASPGTECDDSVNVSQLNLVDLAGSERASQAGTTKQRLREGCHINKSLTTLGVVIRQLSSPGEQGYVNFRDSKLTRILQSSLGGNAKTGIICAVTPTSLDETHSTLKFATCAKEIQNKPIVNSVISDATQLKMLTKQLESLQREVQTKKNLEEDNQKLQQKISVLREQILMGIGDREPIQRNLTNRRWTYCGPDLATISEDGFQPLPLKNDNYGSSIFQRLSNVSERNESIVSNQESVLFNTRSMSTPKIQDKEVFPESIICLDDSMSHDSSNGICSPTHKCFEIHRTPPCILKDRVKSAERELKKLEEMTSLERLHNPKEFELIKHSRDIKLKLQDTMEELQKVKHSEIELQTTIDDLINKHQMVESNKLQFERKIEELKCENEGLIYQFESSKMNHKKREEELLVCLDEARNRQNLDMGQRGGSEAKSRISHIPILAENQRKGNVDEMYSDSFVLQHPSFLEKEIELREQIKINDKFKLKIEELEFKLEVCNEKIAELSNENIKYVNFPSEADKLNKVIAQKDLTMQQYVNQIESCKLAVQQIISQEDFSEPSKDFDLTFEKFPEVQTLIGKYTEICKKVQEKICSCDTIKDKLVYLENVNNEMRTKMEHLTKTIIELNPVQISNIEHISEVKIMNTNVSLIEYLNNLFVIARDTQNVMQNLFKIDLIIPIHNTCPTPMKNDDEVYTKSSPMDISKIASEEIFITEKSSDTLSIQNIPMNSDLSDSIEYLESIVGDFEDNLSKLLTEFRSDVSVPQKADESIITESCLPIFKNLCMKFENTEYLHTLLLNKFENQNLEFNVNNIKLIEENKSLKAEIQEALQSIQELSIESEELLKKVLCSRNEQAMSHAEFSLMTSHFKAANHYHSSLHFACDLSIPYLREQLLKLQLCLQNQSIDNCDSTYLLNSSYENLFSNQIEDPEQIQEKTFINVDHSEKECTGVLIADYKQTCDQLNEKLESKNKENGLLLTSIEELKTKIKILEAENSTLSDQLMEYIEEADYLNNKKDVKNSDVGVNTTVLTNTQTSTTSPIKNNKYITMESLEDNLKRVFSILQIDFEIEEESNISTININLERSILKIKSLLSQQHDKNDEINKLNDELKSLTANIESKNITEMELSCALKNELQTRNVLESEIAQCKFENSHISKNLCEITDKCDALAKLETELQQIILGKQMEISQFIEEINKLKLEIINKNEICNSKDHQIEQLSSKLISLNNEILSKNDIEKNLQGKIEDLKKVLVDLDELHIKYDNTLKDMHNKDNEIGQLNGELLKLTDFQECFKAQESSKDKQIQELRSEILRLNEKLQLNLNNDVQLINDLEIKISILQNSLELCESEKTDKNKEVEILNVELTSLRNASDSKLESESQLNSLRNTVLNLQECIELRELEIAQKNTDIVHLKTDIQSLEKKWKDTFYEKCKAHDELKVRLQNEKQSNEIEYNAKCKEYENLKCEINSLEEQSRLSVSNYDNLIDDLKLKVSQLQGYIDSHESQNSTKDIEIQKLKMEIIKLTQETQSNITLKNCIKDYENVISSQKEKLSEIHMKIDNLAKDNDELKQLLKNKQMEIDHFSKVNSNVKEFEHVMNNEIEKLKYECKNYTLQLKVKTNNELKLMDELRVLKVQKNLLESNVKTYESENSMISSKYNETVFNAQSKIRELNNVIEMLQAENMKVKSEGDAKEKEINQLQTEMKSLIMKLQTCNNRELEIKEIFNNEKAENLKLKEKIAELKKSQSEVENQVSKNNLGFNEEMMQYFVDKMTHEMALEKNKELQKINDDLRGKNKECVVEIRRLQHSLQNNTVTNLMPNNRTTEQREHILLLESTLKEKENELREYNTKYNDLNEEYETFIKVFKDTESQCSDLYTENEILKARVANCEMELDESKENSQNQERRKKRQSLHDMNRGCYTGVNNSMNGKNPSEKENHKKLELEKENSILHKNINELQNKFLVLQKSIPQNLSHSTCQNCTNNELLLKEYNRLKVRNSDLEARLLVQAPILTQVSRPQLQSAYGSGGIVMNQKLCEYIAENQRLQDNNSKLKELCRMRDKKIKELEGHGRK